MSSQEIKNMIDQKIAGQGTMVDVGGALPIILKELVEQTSEIPGIAEDVEELQGKTPMFVTIFGTPTESMTTKDQLANIGLTEDNLNAIASARVAYIKGSGRCFPIELIFANSTHGVYTLQYRDDDVGERYRIDINGNNATVVVTPAVFFDPKIELSALPTADITSVAGLDAIGLTRANLQDIALGKKCFIYYDGDFYQILSATFSGEGALPISGTLKFARFYIDNSAMAGVEYDIVFNEIPSQPTTVTVKQL